jgi:hypothetical protein
MILSKLRAPCAAAVAVGLFMTRTTLVGAGTDPGFVVPVDDESGWRLLSYRGRPNHQVRFDDSGLTIEVAASAGPILRVLPAPMRVTAVKARGAIRGRLDVTAERQGQPRFDDFALRVGLVEVGSRRPGFLERRVAPEWLRTLFDLAPPGTGVSGVRFFNLGVSPVQVGRHRRHPTSALVSETIVGAPAPDGRFQLELELEEDVRTAAIWIATDGDDTRSAFTVVLEHLELEGGRP